MDIFWQKSKKNKKLISIYVFNSNHTFLYENIEGKDKFYLDFF